MIWAWSTRQTRASGWLQGVAARNALGPNNSALGAVCLATLKPQVLFRILVLLQLTPGGFFFFLPFY